MTSLAADSYPAKPVRLLVPYPPGTGTDVVSRVIAQKMSETWGQPVVVENRAGASGMLATEAAAKAAPDGYTLVMSDIGALTINPAVYRTMPYDTLKDLVPIVDAAFVPMFLVVHPSVPARTLVELVALAKNKPGQLNYGTPGVGSAVHLISESLNLVAGIDTVHVPYKGATPALADLAGGQLTFAFASEVSSKPFVDGGRLRVLAIAAEQRSPTMPDVPTFSELGYKGFVGGVWMGILAPAGTPADVVTRVNADVNRALKSPDVVKQLSMQGVQIVGGTPAQFADHIRREIDTWGRVVKTTGVKLE